MNIEYYKSRELLLIQKILAWQTARALGYENEEDIKDHATLLLIDYDNNMQYPLMVGKCFRQSALSPTEPAPWSKIAGYITGTLVDERDRRGVSGFLSYESVKTKYGKGKCLDALDYISMVQGEKRYTHLVQYIFEDSQCPEDRHLLCCYWLVEIDSFRRNQNALMYMAEHDPLTGLYNRHKLEKIRLTLPENVTYVMCDLNHFKDVNDTYGHDAGDHALVAFANRLEEIFYHKKRDLEFRLGGDEFLVIVINTPEESIMRSLEELSKPVPVEDGFSVSASIGYGPTLKSADRALYQVKESGRKGFCRVEE